MNILLPDSWLREYLDTKATPAQIKNCLSLCGPTVDRVNKLPDDDDYVYEIEISSNRVDMAGVYGIAREAAAILPRFNIAAKLTQLKVDNPPQPVKQVPMDISDPQKNCNRILGIVMEVDGMKPAPLFIKNRIEKSGVRSLNNLVDITNYVMLEMGHPSHVFDYDRVKTHKFILRRAKKNEPIITLDSKKYLLSDEDVIIDDGTGRVIDLPGIMGTENSVVTEKTRRIIFFIESNNPVLIRRTSMRYGIRTMAASINEKHPDPELAKTALLRGIELYQKFAGGKVAGKIIDIYPNPTKPKNIKVTTQFINERLGIKLNKNEIIEILKSLSFTVSDKTTSGVAGRSGNVGHDSPDGGGINITPPTYRQFDVTIPEDIVEEVARIYGYHNLPSKLMTGEIPITDKPKILEIEDRAKQMLKFWGHSEVYNYSFISKELIDKTGLSVKDHLKVANPLTSEIEYMRISLIPSMLETVAKNQFYKENLRTFELANVYQPQDKSLPDEYSMLAIANQESFLKLKGIVEALFKELGINDVVSDPQISSISTWTHFWHPKQSLSMSKNGKAIANLGKIHPAMAQNFQIKNDLYLAILNVELLAQFANPAKTYAPIPIFPAAIEDMTIQYPPKTYIGPVISEIYKTSKLVKNVEVIDRYKNSTTLRITYQNKEKNLESESVKKIRKEILKVLQTKFNITSKQ